MSQTTLDSRIRETVRLLRELGFEATEFTPSVILAVIPAKLVEEADRLLWELQRLGVEEGVTIEASYSPIRKEAVLLLSGLRDERLKGDKLSVPIPITP